jgi:hypothetical protein
MFGFVPDVGLRSAWGHAFDCAACGKPARPERIAAHAAGILNAPHCGDTVFKLWNIHRRLGI